MPAVERYDGPLFRVLRRYLDDPSGQVPSIWVLSAKHGVISGDARIRDYDHQLKDPSSAPFLRLVGSGLSEAYQKEPWDEALVFGGRAYREALSVSAAALRPSPPLRLVGGSIGGQASRLRRWLRAESMNTTVVDQKRNRTVRMGGITVSSRAAEVLELAASRAGDDPASGRFESWCVDTRVGPVAPKWITSMLFKKPVSSFRTADARRALEKLGVVVRHADCD